MPCMTWPCIDNYCAATHNLFDVISAALDANRIDVVRKAVECAQHTATFSGQLTIAQHLAFTTNARLRALNGIWDGVNGCIQSLDHLPGGGGSGTTSGTQTVAKKGHRTKTRIRRRRRRRA